MLISRSGYHLFADYDLHATLDNFSRSLEKEIEANEEFVRAANDTAIEEMAKQKAVPQIVLKTEDIAVSHQEVEIPAEYFPRIFNVDRYRTFPKPVYTFRLPFEGDPKTFRCRPSSFLMGGLDEAAIEDNYVIFEVIGFSDDADQIAKERDDFVKNLQTQVSYANRDIQTFNEKLTQVIKGAVERSKTKMSKQNDVLSKLGNKPYNG